MADDGRDKQTEKAAHIEAYSQRIIHLRRILPIIAVLLLGLLVLAANPDFTRPPNQRAAEAGDARLVIDRPVFDGRLSDGRAYRLIAAQGVQKNNGDMAFAEAQMNIAPGSQSPGLSFTAGKGFFSPQRPGQDGTARLQGNVVAQTGDGYEIRAPKAEMNLRAGLWQAAGGITMTGADSTLRAARLAADENTGIYRFENIRMRLVSADKGAQ